MSPQKPLNKTEGYMGIELFKSNRYLCVRLKIAGVGKKADELMEAQGKQLGEMVTSDLKGVVFDLAQVANGDPGLTRYLIQATLGFKKSGLKELYGTNLNRGLAAYVRDNGVALRIGDYNSLIYRPEDDKKAKSPLNAEFINPFFDGVIKVLGVQCKTKCVPGAPSLSSSHKPEENSVSAMIGLNSDYFKGVVSICFPQETFLGLMNRMLGEERDKICDELKDGASEILNMIFGSAKTQLTEKGYSIKNAIPSVIEGRREKVTNPCLHIPFESDVGLFEVEIQWPQKSA